MKWTGAIAGVLLLATWTYSGLQLYTSSVSDGERGNEEKAIHLLLAWPPLLGFAVAGLVLWYIDRKTARALINLRCPTCNYDRRGLAPAAACPECNAENKQV